MTALMVETARLRLRGHGVEDFAACAAMWADPVVTRYIGGRPFSGEEAWTRLLRYAGHWALLGFGYWVAEERSTGAFVGELGFADYQRDLSPGWTAGPRRAGSSSARRTERATPGRRWERFMLGAIRGSPGRYA